MTEYAYLWTGERMTASVMYNRPLARWNWASTLLGAQSKPRYRLGLEWVPRRVDRSLRETQLPLGGFENVDRTNELLLRDQLEPPSFQESIIGRVQAYTAGYEHDVDL